MRKVSAELRHPLPTRFAVIAMGRFGGHEVGYGSDADVLFVHDPLPGRPNGRPRTPPTRWRPSCGGCSCCRCPIPP